MSEEIITRRRITQTYFEYLVVQRKLLIKRYRECYILHGIGEELGRYIVVDRDRRSIWSPSQESVSDCERLIDQVYPIEEEKKQAFSWILIPLLLIFVFVVWKGTS